MSPIALPIAELKPALLGLGKIIAKRTTLPVLNHLKIERTKEGWIALTATDLDHFITVRLEQPSEGEPLCLLVPYDDLTRIAKNCPKTDSLLITGNDKNVTIQFAVGAQVADAKLASFPAQEFPETPRLKGEPVAINDALRQSIHEAMACASEDETRLILNSAYIDVSRADGHYVVGTNGMHLFSSNSFKLPLKECLILRTHKFIGYRDFNNDGEWQLRTVAPQHKDDHGWIQLSSRRWRFIAKQLEGAYPKWSQVVPTPSQFHSALEFAECDSLADTIDRLPDHDARDHTIGIERKGRSVNLLWKADAEQPWKRLPIAAEKLTGPDITIYVSRLYLSKALRFGLGRVEFIDPMSPIRFSEGGRQMIVMPIRAASTVTPATTNPPPTPTPAAAQPSPPPPAETKETSPMPAAQSNGHTNGAAKTPATAATNNTTTLETALGQIEVIKGDFRNAIAGLNKLTEHLKQVQREQKTSEKEIQSVRAHLRSLKDLSVRI